MSVTRVVERSNDPRQEALLVRSTSGSRRPRTRPETILVMVSHGSHCGVAQRTLAWVARRQASIGAASREIAVPKFDPSVLCQTLCRPAFPRGECRRGQSCPPPLPFVLAVSSSVLLATVCTRMCAMACTAAARHAREMCRSDARGAALSLQCFRHQRGRSTAHERCIDRTEVAAVE